MSRVTGQGIEVTVWARTVTISIDPLPDTIEARAIVHYQQYGPVTRVNRRGLVCYARHHHTAYEALLSAMRGYPGDKRHAARILKRRANALIGQQLAGRQA